MLCSTCGPVSAYERNCAFRQPRNAQVRCSLCGCCSVMLLCPRGARISPGNHRERSRGGKKRRNSRHTVRRRPSYVSRFRAIVAATAVPNDNPIPDGSTLYTCQFTVIADPAGTGDLLAKKVIASGVYGSRLDATGIDGRIFLYPPVCTPPPCNRELEVYHFGNCPGRCCVSCATPTPSQICVGDCDNDQCVDVSEVITGIAIALGLDDIGNCSKLDFNGDGLVMIDELLIGVTATLQGCSTSS